MVGSVSAEFPGKRTSEVIGKSLTESSFLDDNGNVVEGAIIDPKNTSGISFANKLMRSNISIEKYMFNARSGRDYDFKKQGVGKRNSGEALIYFYRAMPFEGVNGLGDVDYGVTTYATARDVGNFVAGYFAGEMGVSWQSAREAFDILESIQLKKPSGESAATQAAERLGFNVGRKIYDERNPFGSLINPANAYPPK